MNYAEVINVVIIIVFVLVGEEDIQGGLTFEQAVKLGLYNVKTGRMRDPLTGEMLSLQEAIEVGILNPRGPAITNISTGKHYTLREAIEEGMVRTRDGRIQEEKITSMGITLDPSFAHPEGRKSPVNFEDAILVGLLNLETAQYMDPQTGHKMSLALAVSGNLIDTSSAMIVDPSSGDKISLESALKAGVVDPATGDFIDPDSGKRVMGLKDAFSAGLIESTFLPEEGQVINEERGTRVDLGKAIRDGVVEGDDILVYDSRLGKRVSLSSALRRGMVDQMTGEYIDRDTGIRTPAKEAAKMGLMAVVGAPVLGGMALAEGMKRLTQTVRQKIDTQAKAARLVEKVKIREAGGQAALPAPADISATVMDIKEVIPKPTPEMPALPRAQRQEQAEAKASDYITETSPVVVETEEGHYKAVQRVTMKREAKQVGTCFSRKIHFLYFRYLTLVLCSEPTRRPFLRLKLLINDKFNCRSRKSRKKTDRR